MVEFLTNDIEVLPNCFISVFFNVSTKQYKVFEISERINEFEELYSFFYDDPNSKIIIGYNINGYDIPVQESLFDNYFTFLTAGYRAITNHAFDISSIITDRDNPRGNEIRKRSMNKTKIVSIDLMTLLFPPKMQASLKEVQVTLKHHNVLEFHHDWRVPIPANLIDELIFYCKNDNESTALLFNYCLPQIKLRQYISKTYGFNCFSMDGVKTGVEYLGRSYCKAVGISYSDFQYKRHESKPVPVKDILYPFLKFETESLQELLEYYKGITLYPKQEYPSKRVFVDGKPYDTGAGGLHRFHKPEIIVPPIGSSYYQSDVSSYYPSQIVRHKLLSKHFHPIFLKIFEESYNMKAEGKAAKDKIKETFAKLLLNSYFGQLLNEYSPFFAPEIAFSITVNGQLMLLMLVEKLTLAKFNVVSSNTDAVDVIVPDDRLEEYMAICKWWEDLTLMKLDHEKISKVVRMNCNNYLMIKEDGKTKCKGAGFKTDIELGKGYRFPIIKKAIFAYYVNNIPIEQTIKNCDDIHEFCGYEKTNRDYQVEWNNLPQQRINRFYVSYKAGAYLFKSKQVVKAGKTSTRRACMLADSPVILFNKFEQKLMSEYHINYGWYINQARKTIDEIAYHMNTLF